MTPVDDHPSATSLRWRGLVCLLLLAASTVFMTIAQYLHLKLTQLNTAEAIFVSWGVAFFECACRDNPRCENSRSRSLIPTRPADLLQVPANRMGHARQGGPFSAPVLRVVAELFSLSAFAVFSAVVLGQPPTAKGGAGFALIFLGVAVAMGGREAAHRRKGQTAAAPGGAETEEAVLDA